MVWCVCVIPPLWRGPPTPVAPRASVEGLEQQGPLRAGEVRADEVALEAAEPLAQPVEVALVGDREQDRGAGNGLISDGLELLLGDADALEMLVERPGSGTDGDRPEHGDEEEGPDQEPPERPPAGAPPLVVTAVPQGWLLGSLRPLEHGTVDDLHEALGARQVELLAGRLGTSWGVELPRRKRRHRVLLVVDGPAPSQALTLPPFASSEHHQGSRATTTCSSTSRGSDPESRTAEWNRRTSNPSP